MGGLGVWFGVGVGVGGFFRWGRYDVWAVDRKQLAVDDCYADTEYEVYAADARYEDGTSCQTLERRQLPRSTRYHAQGELENVRQVSTAVGGRRS